MTIKHRNCCRVCHGTSLVKFLDLGDMPLAGGFLRSDELHNEKKYPLQVYFCKNCSLVQILDVIDQDTLFFNYKYPKASRMDAAVEHAQRALDLARQNNERGREAYALRVFGEIAAHKDPPGIGEADDYYHQAITLAEELGMRPLIARCHVGLGRLYRQIGNLEQAKRHLTTATSMMREMQMGLWLEQAEAELKELG